MLELIKRPQGSFDSVWLSSFALQPALSVALCIELGIVLSHRRRRRRRRCCRRRRLCFCIPFDAANQYEVYHKISLHTYIHTYERVVYVLYVRAVRLAKPTRQQRDTIPNTLVVH